MSARNPILLTAAEYSPDMPALENPGSANILNCIPKTPQSYGPFSSLSAWGNALANRCQGAYALTDASGDVYLFCGDASDLFYYSAGSSSATNASSSSGAYSTPLDGQWNFTLFGQRVVATNFADGIQSFLLGTDSKFSALSASAPKARYMDIAKGFLLVANTEDTTYGAQPQRVWWPALNDPTNWPTPGTATAAEYQSSYNDLFGNGGWIQGIVGNLGTADAAVFLEREVWRMVYAGPPVVWDFFPAEGVRGTPAPNSLIHVGPYVYYLGQDGFYVFDGTSSLPIGVNKVDKTFFDMVNQSYLYRVWGSFDPVNKIVYWAFPSTASQDGTPDYILAYNWFLKRFALIQISCEIIFPGLAFGYTLSQLDSFGTLETMPQYPLGSRAWTNGSLILGGFNSSHAPGYFNGSTLAATIQTTERNLFPGQRAIIQNTRPLVDGGTPSVSIYTRNRLIDSAVKGSSISINPLGNCPLIGNGRYVRGEMTIPSGSSWQHFQGIEVEATEGGLY